jgi:hypothetical protein
MDDERVSDDSAHKSPFSRWNKKIINLTSKTINGDIHPAYMTIFKITNQCLFKGLLL